MSKSLSNWKMTFLHPGLFFILNIVVLFLSIPLFANELPTQTILLGRVSLVVEMATTEEQQMRGLMYRKSLPQDRGMLFVFSNEEERQFWMKNTYIPLTIAYFDADGNFINSLDMNPTSVVQVEHPRYRSEKPAKYALEVNKGWFQRKKIDLSKVKLKFANSSQ